MRILQEIKKLPSWVTWAAGLLAAVWLLPKFFPAVMKFTGATKATAEAKNQQNKAEVTEMIKQNPSAQFKRDGTKIDISVLDADVLTLIHDGFRFGRPWWDVDGWYEEESKVIFPVLNNYSRDTFYLLAERYKVKRPSGLPADLKQYLSSKEYDSLKHLWS